MPELKLSCTGDSRELSYELAATKSVGLSSGNFPRLAQQAGDRDRGDGAILHEADVASPNPGGAFVVLYHEPINVGQGWLGCGA